MSDYDAAPNRKVKDIYCIPGQTKELCADVREADARGVSYGVYMGIKHDMQNQEYYEKFGVRLKRRHRV